MTVAFRQRLDQRRDAGGRARRGLRPGARGGLARPRPAALRRPADGRHGPPLRVDRRDEDRRGQDPGVDAAGLPQRPGRQRRPRGDRQRLPGHPRLRVDGPPPPVPRPDRRPGGPGHLRRRREARGLLLRRHLRHQHRVRLRLPARQHGPLQGRHGPARPPLRHHRRGRLDPHRRGPDPAHHLRAGRRVGPALLPVRRHRPHPSGRGRLRGRRGEAHRRADRGRHREGRAPARRGQPVRRGGRQLRAPPDPGPAGQGALQAGQGLPGGPRRGPHRRRVHRAHPRRPALVRRPPPGRRGQGAGQDQRGEPHLGHGDPPELLPPLREARRHDRHGRDRGLGVRQHLRAPGRPDPAQPAARPRPTSPT